MINWIYKNKTKLKVIGVTSILIPLFYLTYIVITIEGNSTVVSIDSVFGIAILAYYILLISALIVYAIYWFFKQVKQIINLKNEKNKTELRHLKSQVNPHFFFNTLNNLYGLVDEDAVKAKQLILKLSDMMRYSIYEGLNDRVDLKDEIDFISNYIELHKMRYHKNIDVSFATDIENDNLKVMPLLFIILVENAFKHGAEVLRKNSFVHIKLVTKKNEIHFQVENNFDETYKTEKGIGLKNLKRRLELEYEKNHSFSTKTINNVFKSTLKIHL